jgi:phosphoesterase RecJ-like protein
MDTTQDPTLDPAKLRALELLKRGKRFLVSGHVRPDGDCLGAQASLSRVLGALGKEVRVLNADAPEERYGFLAESVDFGVYQGGALPEHDVAILVDFSDMRRCGPLYEPLRAAPSKKLVVDHHVHEGQPWWDEAFVDVSASASGLLVYRIAEALEVPLDTAAARGVFTSIVTDTGWFKYSNTDAETLAVAAALVSRGVDPSELYGAVFQTRGQGQPRYVELLLASLEVHADGRLAVIQEPRAVREGLGADAGEVDSDEVLDILRSVGAIEVVLHLREMTDGTCKLSARSKTDYDVQALARGFDGGGHRRAAGASIPGGLAAARERVVAAAIEAFAVAPQRAR